MSTSNTHDERPVPAATAVSWQGRAWLAAIIGMRGLPDVSNDTWRAAVGRTPQAPLIVASASVREDNVRSGGSTLRTLQERLLKCFANTGHDLTPISEYRGPRIGAQGGQRESLLGSYTSLSSAAAQLILWPTGSHSPNLIERRLSL